MCQLLKGVGLHFRQFLDENTIFIFNHKQGTICYKKWSMVGKKNKVFKRKEAKRYLTFFPFFFLSNYYLKFKIEFCTTEILTKFIMWAKSMLGPIK